MRNQANETVSDAADQMTAQADAIQSKVRQASTAAWDATKQAYQQIQEKTRAGVRATDHTIREYPYASLGVVFALGLLIGLLAGRGNGRSRD